MIRHTEDHVEALLEIVRSPVTGARLALDGGLLRADGDLEAYPVVDGIPILIDKRRSLFDEANVSNTKWSSRSSRLRAWFRRRLLSGAGSARNLEALRELLAPTVAGDTRRRRVLVVGGGILGFGLEALDGRDWLQLIETDVYIGPRTQIVCDAHDLPFASGIFDAVVIQAVLEHVIDPVRVVAEIHRTLSVDGLIYSEVPFIQQVHEGPYDFTRWTLGGHRRLMHDFHEIAAGAIGGPGEALAWSLRYFLLALAGDIQMLRTLASLAGHATGIPLRALDRAIGGRPAAVDAAAGTYFLGRRRGSPRLDADIVAAYAGALEAPTR